MVGRIKKRKMESSGNVRRYKGDARDGTDVKRIGGKEENIKIIVGEDFNEKVRKGRGRMEDRKEKEEEKEGI